MMRKILAALIASCLAGAAVAQNFPGQFPAGNICGNATGAPNVAGCTPIAPQTARSSVLLNIDGNTNHGDSNYQILATDRVVSTSAALTAPRTWTLPLASSVNAGQNLQINDLSGGVTATNTLTVARNGSDTINGQTTAIMSTSGAQFAFYSDGVSKWSAQVTPAANGGSGIQPSGTLYALSQPGVSGSNQSTTGTISATSTSLTLASALDFANGQGIRCNQAGANAASAATAGQAVVTVGAAGATTYTYAVFGIDANGGLGASGGNVSIATGNATLNGTNYNSLSWNAAAGAVGYAIYGRIGGSLTFMGFRLGTTFFDQGQTFPTPPDWLPAAVPANAGFPQWLVSSISSGGGTTAITLANTATNSITAQFCRHDDTAALNTAIGISTTTNQSLYLNDTITAPGQFWVSSSLNASTGSYGLKLFAQDAYGTVINVSSACQDVLLLSNSNRHYLHNVNVSFPGGSFMTCGAMVHNTGGIGSSYERLHLIGGFVCIQDASGTWWSDHVDASCSNSVYSLTTPGDSTITRGYISPYLLQGAASSTGILVGGDPGGLRIVNNKIIGNGASTMVSGISATATLPDGDFFVIGNSIENFNTYGFVFTTNSTTAFGNIVAIANEIVGGANTLAAISIQGTVGGPISGVVVADNPNLTSGGVGVQIAGTTKKFTVQGNHIPSVTGIGVSAAATGCMIGVNTFISTTQIVDSSAACTYAQITAVKPTYPFLLRRDLDPAANDNRPMWLNSAA